MADDPLPGGQPQSAQGSQKQQTFDFSTTVLTWFDSHGRHDLPWQKAVNAYRVWVSEVMLQQTQVSTVIPYYNAFMHRFPELNDLADASQDEVLKYWQGLGYYSRARNLHRAAQHVRDQYQGQFPQSMVSVQALPGIGRSTAAAILSLAFNQPQAILDGNVKRVLARYFCVSGWPGKSAVEKQLWQLAESLLPNDRYADYTQAMMDLGATLCTRKQAQCAQCPLNQHCQAYLQDQVGAFPSPKPKKQTPIKTAFALVIRKGDHVLLYKREDAGIWGGLWSFPQFDSLNELQAVWPNATADDAWRFVFSHYTLEFNVCEAWVADTVALPEVIDVDNNEKWHWVNGDGHFSGGVTKAVLKFFSQHSIDL